MNALSKTILLVASLVLSAVCAADELTEPAVRALIAKSDAAIAARDVAAIGALLSEGIVIQLTIHAGGKTQKVEMRKPEYMKSLADGYAQYSDFTYQRSDVTIVVEADKATATSQVTESMKVGRQTMRATTDEVTTLQLVDGKLLVTKVVGESTM